MPPKKKACKVRHVDEVATLEHGPRQSQEYERSVTPNGGEIDEVANKIYARIARAVQGGEHRSEGCSFGKFHKQNPPTFNGESNPKATENWVLKMEKLLRALDALMLKRWCMLRWYMLLLLFRILLRDGGQALSTC